MKLQFLGTGTSTGVPQIGCSCSVCRSNDPRDSRLRCSSMLVEGHTHILIDCSPDFRQQALQFPIERIDALLLTHSHYDHTGGIDDLRPYCTYEPLPIYAEPNVINDIRTRLPYCFVEPRYPGIPLLDMRSIAPFQSFKVGDVEIQPLRVMHYKLPIVGYRIGQLAYVTDCLTLPQETLDQLKGLDVLVINALRQTWHIAHQTLDEALALIEQVAPKKAYLIHMSHDMGLHAEVSKKLPPHVELAYDGLIVNC